MMQDAQAPYYRINKFAVPSQSRDAMLGIIQLTHAALRRQNGFVRDLILERQSGPGEFNIITLIEFTGTDVVPRISAVLDALETQTGINRRERAEQLGVHSHMAGYRRLEI